MTYLYPDGTHGVVVFSVNDFWPGAMDRWMGVSDKTPRWIYIAKSSPVDSDAYSSDSMLFGKFVGIDQQGWNPVHLFVFHRDRVPALEDYSDALRVYRTVAERGKNGYLPGWWERLR